MSRLFKQGNIKRFNLIVHYPLIQSQTIKQSQNVSDGTTLKDWRSISKDLILFLFEKIYVKIFRFPASVFSTLGQYGYSQKVSSLFVCFCFRFPFASFTVYFSWTNIPFLEKPGIPKFSKAWREIGNKPILIFGFKCPRARPT